MIAITCRKMIQMLHSLGIRKMIKSSSRIQIHRIWRAKSGTHKNKCWNCKQKAKQKGKYFWSMEDFYDSGILLHQTSGVIEKVTLSLCWGQRKTKVIYQSLRNPRWIFKWFVLPLHQILFILITPGSTPNPTIQNLFNLIKFLPRK